MTISLNLRPVNDLTGALLRDPIGLFQCSAATPCTNIGVNAINLHLANGTAVTGWLCDDLRRNTDFHSMGKTCWKGSSMGYAANG
ncbi:hypothetical protein BKA65DRAFT_494212 [Rhexocercosporidium sp. MPI-PUGE-AT-0058]|nr:hypothetical protein BKA65DRAFT_494212 [Rhexocercosporidium sp. MPI-PUGE-AT-0058]